MFYVASRCAHRGSARFEDVVKIEARIRAIGNTSVTSTYVVRGPEGTLIAEAELTSVCVDVTSRAPVRVPDRLRDAVARADA
jgi:acyl-CoA thioesterase FadM